MSDVEKQIEQWRAGLGNSDVLGGSDVTELENHLRDQMEPLKNSGLSETEAFLVARSRLGDSAALEGEFAKVNVASRLRNRLCWMIAGVLAYWMAVQFSSAVSSISVAIAYATSQSPQVSGIVASVVRIVAFCAMTGFIVWLCARYFRLGSSSRTQITKRMRIAFLAALVVTTVGSWFVMVCGVVYVARGMPIKDYAQITMVQAHADFAWRLAGPLLLGVLLVVTHLAGRQKVETRGPLAT